MKSKGSEELRLKTRNSQPGNAQLWKKPTPKPTPIFTTIPHLQQRQQRIFFRKFPETIGSRTSAFFFSSENQSGGKPPLQNGTGVGKCILYNVPAAWRSARDEHFAKPNYAKCFRCWIGVLQRWFCVGLLEPIIFFQLKRKNFIFERRARADDHSVKTRAKNLLSRQIRKNGAVL